MHKIIAIMDHQHLSIEIKTKIITLREHTPHTWAERAEMCGCSVSFIFLLDFSPTIILIEKKVRCFSFGSKVFFCLAVSLAVVCCDFVVDFLII